MKSVGSPAERLQRQISFLAEVDKLKMCFDKASSVPMHEEKTPPSIPGTSLSLLSSSPINFRPWKSTNTAS